jgi:hypothetical protein
MNMNRSERRRQPSRLAKQLADAFAPCAQWSEVRIERGAGGRRTRVIVGPPSTVSSAGPAAPFDWAIEAP